MAEQTYTLEQLKSADTFAQILADIPADVREQVILMANSFLLGAQAQEAATKSNQ